MQFVDSIDVGGSAEVQIFADGSPYDLFGCGGHDLLQSSIDDI